MLLLIIYLRAYKPEKIYVYIMRCMMMW
jgi:hypothetical protein